MIPKLIGDFAEAEELANVQNEASAPPKGEDVAAKYGGKRTNHAYNGADVDCYYN